MEGEQTKTNVRAVIMWMTMSAGFALGFFHRYGLSAVSENLAGELNLTGSQLGNLSSMYFYAYAIMQIPVGILADKIGVRRVTSAGMVLAGASALLFSVSNNIIVLYVARFFVGIGVSTMLVSILKLLSVWFRSDDFVKFNGWTSIFGTCGTILASAPLAFVAGVIGWRASFFVMSLVTIADGVAIWFIVRDYPEGYEHTPGEQSSGGLLKDLKDTLTNPYLWGIFVFLLGVFGIAGSFTGLWAIPYFMHIYGLSSQEASSYILFNTAGALIMASSISVALKLVKGNRVRLIRLGCILFVGIWVVVLYVFGGKPPLLMMPFALLLMGMLNPMMNPIYSLVKEACPKHLTGLSTGFVNLAPFLSSIFLNAVIGLRLDQTWQGEVVNDARVYTIDGYIQSFSVYVAAALLSLAMAYLVLGKMEKKRTCIKKQAAMIHKY